MSGCDFFDGLTLRRRGDRAGPLPRRMSNLIPRRATHAGMLVSSTRNREPSAPDKRSIAGRVRALVPQSPDREHVLHAVGWR